MDRQLLRQKLQKHFDQFDGSSLLPDSSSLSVIVEHAVPLLPDDVLGLLPHDVLHHALELDGGALVVEDPVLNLLVTLVHDFYSWH